MKKKMILHLKLMQQEKKLLIAKKLTGLSAMMMIQQLLELVKIKQLRILNPQMK